MDPFTQWKDQLLEPHLAGLTVARVEEYLRKTGDWEQVNFPNSKLHVWRTTRTQWPAGPILFEEAQKGFEIVFPAEDKYEDTRRRLIEVVNLIAAFEDITFADALKAFEVPEPRREFTVKDLVAYQRGLTPFQRTELWNSIADGYCRECGTEDPNGTCQCWNDD